MKVEIDVPELSSEQFGQLVDRLARQANIVGEAAEQLLAIRMVAAELGRGTLRFARPAPAKPEAKDEDVGTLPTEPTPDAEEAPKDG